VRAADNCGTPDRWLRARAADDYGIPDLWLRARADYGTPDLWPRAPTTAPLKMQPDLGAPMTFQARV